MFALARQIGILHQRYASTGARIMNVGLNIGENAPILDIQDINENQVTLGMNRGKNTLLLFISTGCSVCATLLPYLNELIYSEADNLEIKLIAFGVSPQDGKRYALEHSLINSPMPFIVSDNLALHYKVTLAPYGIIIDQGGIIRSKGLVNSSFDLESLLNAEELGVKSIQEYFNVVENNK